MLKNKQKQPLNSKGLMGSALQPLWWEPVSSEPRAFSCLLSSNSDQERKATSPLPEETCLQNTQDANRAGTL